MLTFTVDTNCIIDVEEDREDTLNIRALSDAHGDGRASVAVCAMSASENQKGAPPLTNYQEFKERLDRLGLAHLDVILPMAYLGVAFWDHALFAGEDELKVEERIHNVLFPNVEFAWADYATARGLPVDGDLDKDWRNKKCDVQMMWAHINSKRDVFVTNDMNFHRPQVLAALSSLGLTAVVTPREAAAML